MKTATILLFLSSIFSLFLYSFSQIDLNLTLSTNSFYQLFQNKLIELGYYHRQESTLFFVAITLLLTVSYLLFLYLAYKKKISAKLILALSAITALILLFSYPAFSYDIYNYIFDARIFVQHHANPYTHTALMFPDDLWTRFMRWTHRTYPYGPTWIMLTSVTYFLGLGKFTLTLILFKLLGFISYLISAFSIYKISKYFKFKNPQLNLVFFLFNPLIIIEMLVSAHIDAVMAALMLFGIYFFTVNKKTISWIHLLFSAGIKYTSFALLPFWYFFQKGFLSFSKTIFLSLIGSIALTFYIISQREILPWYLITPLALLSLLKPSKNNVIISVSLTLATLLRYAPFLYYGDYTPLVYLSRDIITITLVVLGVVVLIVSNIFSSKNE